MCNEMKVVWNACCFLDSGSITNQLISTMAGSFWMIERTSLLP